MNEQGKNLLDLPQPPVAFRIFGSRVLFWLLAPWLLVCIPVFIFQMLSCMNEGNSVGALLSAVLAICCLCGLLIGINSRRFGWTLIFITLAVPAAYIWYFYATFFVDGQRITPSGKRSAATPWNAVMGFIVFGVPCLMTSYRMIRERMCGEPETDCLTISFSDESLLLIANDGAEVARIPVSEVREVFAFKRDLLSVDLICLGFRIDDEGTFLEANEEMEGFAECLEELPDQFEGIEVDWFADIAFPAFKTNCTTIWGESRIPTMWEEHESD